MINDNWFETKQEIRDRKQPANSMVTWGNKSVTLIEEASAPRVNFGICNDEWFAKPEEIAENPKLILGNSALSKSSCTFTGSKDSTTLEAIREVEVKDSTQSGKGIDILMKLHMMATVMEGVANGTIAVAQNWDKVVCGVAGIVGGGAQMISWNPYSIGLGAVRVAASVKIMWDAYDKMQAPEVQEIVNDSKASVEAISLLAKSNEKYLKRLQEHLSKAEVQAKETEKQLTTIAALATYGNEAAAEAKQKASEGCKAVNESLKQAQAKFAKANELSIEAQTGFKEVIDSLNEMITLFNTKEGDLTQRMEQLAALTKKISGTAEAAHEKMTEAQDLRSEGDVLLNQVMILQGKTSEEYGKALGMAHETLKKIDEESEKARLALNMAYIDLNQGQDLINNDIKPTNTDIQKIAENAVEDLGLLHNIVNGQNNTFKLFAAAATAIAFNAVMGPIPTILLTVAVVKYSHSVVNLFTEWLAKKALKVEQVSVNDNIKYEFNAKSESTIDRLRGKISQTAGKLSIKVGKKAVLIGFDFNRKNILSKDGLGTLTNAINDQVGAKNLTKEEALKLISDLKTCDIPRQLEDLLYRSQPTVQKGFIAANEPFLNGLERALGKKVEDMIPSLENEDIDTSIDIHGSLALWC